jgi:hypothetical protein
MSSFNSTAFMISASAIAIFGVALYMWDTRGKSLGFGSSNSAAGVSNPSLSSRPSYASTASTDTFYTADGSATAGSRRKRSKRHKKTKKRR